MSRRRKPLPRYGKQHTFLQRFLDGTFADWGRHGTGLHKGEGGALLYVGEAAKVMALVLKHGGQHG